MYKIWTVNSYFFLVILDGNLKYNGLKDSFEFQNVGANFFDLIYKGNHKIIEGASYEDFVDINNVAFTSEQALIDFYTENETIIISNQIDLSNLESILTDTNVFLYSIETDTTSIESLIESLQNDINSNSSVNHSDILNVITELQGIDENTNDIEDKLSSIISNTSTNSTASNQQLILSELKAKTTTTATTTVNCTTTSASVIVANANRRKVIFENSGNQRIYLKFGGASSASSYTISLAQNEKFPEYNFTGQVFGITSAGNSNLQITELTV